MKAIGEEITWIYDLEKCLPLDMYADIYPGERHVKITFVDGKFKKVCYDFACPYKRGHWAALGLITEEIKRIEKEGRCQPLTK